MRSEIEIHKELREIRKLLKIARANKDHESVDWLYAAQQALVWTVGEPVRSASELYKEILELADKIEAEEHQG